MYMCVCAENLSLYGSQIEFPPPLQKKEGFGSAEIFAINIKVYFIRDDDNGDESII